MGGTNSDGEKEKSEREESERDRWRERARRVAFLGNERGSEGDSVCVHTHKGASDSHTSFAVGTVT
eukprot:6179746-Pleurochrysis_carterae.AAC.1